METKQKRTRSHRGKPGKEEKMVAKRPGQRNATEEDASCSPSVHYTALYNNIILLPPSKKKYNYHFPRSPTNYSLTTFILKIIVFIMMTKL